MANVTLGADVPRSADIPELPRPPVHFIERTRLNTWLEALVSGDCHVVGVWSAAGSGKTSLLANWAAQLAGAGRDVVWLTPADVRMRSRALERVRDQSRSIDASAEPRSELFVFADDVHRLPASVRAAAYRSLEAVPQHVRIVMAGRYQPFASLAFLEASGVMREIRTADLAFDEVETCTLASGHGLELSGESVRALVQHTGGWSTALALAMPWLHDASDPLEAIEDFEGDNRAVADYLMSEVLHGLSDAERATLMSTAVSEFVPLELAIRLTGRSDAGEIMYTLSRRNTLLTEEHGGYRYHPVLMRFLQAEARRQDNSRATHNHKVASQWYTEIDDGSEAIEHAFAAADSATIAAVLERFGLELVLSGKTSALTRAGWKLPRTYDALAAIVVRLLMEAPSFTDSRRAQHLFALAEHRAVTATPSEKWRLALAALHCFAPAAHDDVRIWLDQLSTPEAITTRHKYLSLDLLAATAEAWSANRSGDPESAAGVFEQVATAAHRAGYDWLYLLSTEAAASIAHVSGDWAHAAALEDQMVARARSGLVSLNDRAGAGAIIVMAARRYHRCQSMRTDMLDGIITADPLGIDLGLLLPARILGLLPLLDSESNPRQALDDLERLIREAGHKFPRLVAAAALRVTDMRLALDGRERARDFAEAIDSILGHDSIEAISSRFVLNPPTHIGESAEHQLEDAADSAQHAWHAGAAVSAWILLAQLAHDTGRYAEADTRILRAVRLAAEAEATRPFLARNGQGAALVASRIGRFGHLDGFAQHIVDRADEILPHRAGSTRFIEPLTPREREILLELPVHQSVAEIALKQSLSTNTVKTHLRNIYQKLAATDRSTAVAIAQEHGLL